MQAGIDCLVLDKASFPRNKPCAGWITPEVVKELDLANAGYPYGFSTFPRLYIKVRGFPLIHPSTQHAIRRVEFDDWLLKRSCAPFVQHQVGAIDIKDGGYIVDGKYFGKHIIGAGGTHCPVYHSLFKPKKSRDDGTRIVAREEEGQ
jgi:flavin-dependent dehydrogenase